MYERAYEIPIGDSVDTAVCVGLLFPTQEALFPILNMLDRLLQNEMFKDYKELDEEEDK